jgi:hypothetical protein
MPEGSGNYRYFNQPIEQIPGWDANEPQILFHGKNAGLVWVNIECIPVVTCVELSDESAYGSGAGTGDGDGTGTGDGDGTGTGDGSGSGCGCTLSVTRHNLYVLKDAGINSETCINETQSLSVKYIYNENIKSWQVLNPTT